MKNDEVRDRRRADAGSAAAYSRALGTNMDVVLLRTTLFACIGFVFTGICALMGSDQAVRDAE
ncbi:hypothetical protein M3650_19765 [Paenibacillus sp. MER TA 81-3]|nr:hypothetical protein [Paenibacillus sp. MER TA 81-3]